MRADKNVIFIFNIIHRSNCLSHKFTLINAFMQVIKIHYDINHAIFYFAIYHIHKYLIITSCGCDFNHILKYLDFNVIFVPI